MTYGPPSEPTTPDPRFDPTAQHQQPWAPPQPPAAQPGGSGLAVIALLVGMFGCVVWLLPIYEANLRHYLPFPFAIGGIVLSIMCLSGHRRGTTTAVIGLLLSGLALLLGLVMVSNEFLRFLG
ncbi:hypothetical protein [Kutzneria sp. NPDC051319]|uniref:hypothetical protein n=1 Tax=Kutzneria sp. NPDC051319 TaxID=3155047 RepID=UPI00341D41FA